MSSYSARDRAAAPSGQRCWEWQSQEASERARSESQGRAAFSLNCKGKGEGSELDSALPAGPSIVREAGPPGAVAARAQPQNGLFMPSTPAVPGGAEQ